MRCCGIEHSHNRERGYRFGAQPLTEAQALWQLGGFGPHDDVVGEGGRGGERQRTGQDSAAKKICDETQTSEGDTEPEHGGSDGEIRVAEALAGLAGEILTPELIQPAAPV